MSDIFDAFDDAFERDDEVMEQAQNGPGELLNDEGGWYE